MMQTVSSTQAKDPHETIHRLARLGWVVISLLILSLYFLAIPTRMQIVQSSSDWRTLSQIGFSIQGFAVLLAALDFLFILAHYAIAAFIFIRRRRDWLALTVALAMVTNGSLVPLMTVFSHQTLSPGWSFILHCVIYFGLVSSMLLLYLFPTGRFVPAGTVILAAIWAVIGLPAVFAPKASISLASWPVQVQVVVLVIFAVAGVFAQIYRYLTVSNPLQRQQAKWAAFGLSAAALGPFAYFLPFVILPELNQEIVPNILFQRMGGSFFALSQLTQLFNSVIFNLLTLIFPVSFAIAILRYRLWDIDLLVNRALVYGVLSAIILILYLSIVLILELFLRNLTGENQSDLATVASTLAIALAFAPLRRRVQRWVDMRFYRRKYNTARTIEHFSQELRDEVELGMLCERLHQVVDYTMRPEHISLWLRDSEKKA